MKLSVPVPGCRSQKHIGGDDEHKFHTSNEKHLATEVAADALGKEWKAFVVRISGVKDKAFLCSKVPWHSQSAQLGKGSSL